MTLLSLLNQESAISRPRLLAMAALAALANALALGVLNAAATTAERSGLQIGGALLLLGAVLVYGLAQRRVMQICASEVEAIVARLRLRLATRVAQADLLPLEQMGTGDIQAAITGETLTISQAANILVMGFQAAFVTVFVLLYVAMLSLPALVLSIVLLALASRLHLKRLSVLGGSFGASMQADAALFETLDDAVSGIKEIRMDPVLRAAVAAEAEARSLTVMQTRGALQDSVAREFVFMQALFFLLLAAIVFIVPNYSPGHPAVTIQVATAMLFVAGSMSILLQTAPAYARASAAAMRLAALGDRLSAARSRGADRAAGAMAEDFSGFSAIHLDSAGFAYPDQGGEPGFAVGPFDLAIRRGEVVFLVGGNGSGKSTLLKLMTGLYRPVAGAVRVDERVVTADNAASYRALFSIILSDFHLFERLYGIVPDPQRLQRELVRLDLAGVVGIEGDRFSTVALSMGQRKRLAMLVAEQESRPILVLDEWAAEQDPGFRNFFYETMIPELRRRGITVVVATHDDQYFAAADRVLKLEAGRFVPTMDA